MVLACVVLGCGDDGTPGDEDPSSSTSGTDTTGSGDPTTQTTAPTGSPTSEDFTTTTDGPESTSDVDETTGTTGGEPGCVDPSGEIIPDMRTVTTDDGKDIAVTVYRPENGSCLPALLLIHQYTLDQTQWNPQLPTFADAGYVLMTMDIRGHGASDPPDGPLADVLSDPNGAPLDVAAALATLAANPAVDATRIGVIGTSIGANLAVVTQSRDLGTEVAAIAPLSPRLSAVEALADGPAAATNINCYAGALDSGGDQAQTCMDLVAAATGTAVENILDGTSAHGVAIFNDFPGTDADLVEWFNEVL